MEQFDSLAEADDTPPSGQGWEAWRKRLGVVFTPTAFAATYYFCDDLRPEGRRLAAILAAVAVLWVSEILPLPVSALVGAVLCVVLGVADVKIVLAHFADPIVFVFIGSFMLARAMMLHRLDRRIALGFLSLSWVSAHPATMLAGLGLVTALLSMWVSNSATTAMMLPIALGMLGALHEVRVAQGLARGTMSAARWPLATGMMLMVAYGASIGGLGTPVGSPPNLIGIGLIRENTGVDISFFGWMALTLPILLVMAPVLLAVLYGLQRMPRELSAHGTSHAGEIAAGSHLHEFLARERSNLGPWTWGQRNTLLAFAAAVALWMLPGLLQLPWLKGHWLGTWADVHFPESIVALSAALLLFMLPVNLARGEFTLNWREAQQIDWGTILLFGGGLALGSLLFQTGVATALGQGLTSALGVRSLWLLTGLSIALAIVLSETASNTAAANMIIPVVIAIAQAADVSPLPPALGACLGASFGFMLPVSTPPNAIVYGSGLVPLPQMMRAGIIFDILGFCIIWAGLRILCPVLGLL